MATFTKGELITAEKLNQVANDKGAVTTNVDSTSVTFGPYYMPSGGYIYIYLDGLDLLFIGTDNPISLSFWLYKYQNGSWVLVTSFSNEGANVWSSRSWTYNVSSYGGEGWYQWTVRHTRNSTWWNDASCDVSYFPWRNNCVKGDLLYYFDSPDNSGNPRSTGSFLTAEILNTGLVGTKSIT